MTGNPDDRTPENSPGADVNMDQLIDEYSHIPSAHRGDVLTGHVLQINEQGVIVDIGQKLEGFVPIAQVLTQDGQITVQPGDAVEVMVDPRGMHEEGYIVLSHERASKARAWDTLEKAHRESLLVSGRVLNRVKGGLAVDVGVVAFMPGTQVDVRPVGNLDSLIGTDIAVKVIKINRRRDNVVVSRKAALEDEQNSRKSALLEHISEGAVIQGTVKNLTDYGAFVESGRHRRTAARQRHVARPSGAPVERAARRAGRSPSRF